jgi:hypothetical protein
VKTNAFALACALSATVLASCGGGGGLAAAVTPPTTGSSAQAAGIVGGATARSATTIAATPQPHVISNAVENPKAADAFVESIGVDVHLFYKGTAYADDFPAFASLLIASGIRHIRDGVIDTDWQPYYDHLNSLGAAGVHADLITSVNQSVGLISSYPAHLHSSIESFEGPNEYDRSGDPNWASTLASFQQNLYSALSSRYPIIGPSLTSEASWAAVGDLSGSLDYGNMHDYLEGHNPGASGWGAVDAFGTFASIGWNMAVAAQVSKSKAIEATETGYGDVGRFAVPPAVKAKYTVRSLLEHFNRGVRRVYLYEFLDEGNDGFGAFGLVTSTLSPKPAYVAVKTLIGHLADKGPDFVPVPLTYGRKSRATCITPSFKSATAPTLLLSGSKSPGPIRIPVSRSAFRRKRRR